MKRQEDRPPDAPRPIRFTRGFTDHGPGSVLVESGRTKVLCTVTFTDQTPAWLRETGGSWLTAEYSMLPGSTHSRKPRERLGRVDGRSQEIQRLIGRSLRSIVNLAELPEMTIWVDCDVLSADGGTRTAAINGACVALFDAFLYLEENRRIRKWPMNGLVSAVSVGLVDGRPAVDLDYEEDRKADVDMNVVCTSDGRLVEVQGSAEGEPFSHEQFTEMLAMARSACERILQAQRETLGI